PGGLGGSDQIDLVTLDDPAGDVSRIVGFEFLGWEGLDATQQVRVYAHRGADQIVVEEMREITCGGLPAHVLYLTCLRASAAVGVGLGGGGIVKENSAPRCIDVCVESPVR